METKPSVDRPTAPPPAKLDPVMLLGKQLDRLTKIEDHLKSIRSMLNFFTLLAVLTIIFQIVQACSAIGLL